MTDPLIPLVLDFESTYTTEYSLKKMPTAQYVRDDRWECLGAGVRLGTSQAVWLEPDELQVFLDQVPWGRILLVCHNAQFDGLVLTERYGHRPAAYACTMFMLRYLIAQGVLDARMGTSLAEAAPLVGMEKGNLDAALANDTLGEYATDDAAICGALFDRYWHTIPEDEQGFIDIHVRMAVEPVFRLDKPALQNMADADKALESIFPLVRKDDQFAAALTALGVNPEYKTTAKGNLKLALAKTDTFMQSLQNHDNEMVRTLAEVRLKSKSTISRSRSQRFLDVGEPMPVPLLYYGQHPGRASGQDKLNMANMTKEGGMRETLLAPEGHKLIIVDSEQCQVRVEAWRAGQHNLLEAFIRGEDPYLAFTAVRYREDLQALMEQYENEEAEGIYGPVSKKRAVQKAAILALGFMQGAQGFLNHCRRFNVPIEGLEEAQEIVSLYRATYPNHVSLANQCLLEVKQTGKLVLRSGREIHYPDLRITADNDVEWRRPRIFARSVNEGWGSLWRGSVVENCLSGNSEVLTCHGWLPLVEVGEQHLLWDGVEWVKHEGLIFQGVRETIDFGGVEMTPDHKVLTDEGFLPAIQTTYEEAYGHTERLHWRAQRINDGYPSNWFGRATNLVVSSLRLWDREDYAGSSLLQGRGKNLWGYGMSEQIVTHAGHRSLANTRDVSTQGLCGVEVDVRPLSAAYASGVEELWSQGYNRLRAMAGVVRSLLGGHGTNLSGGAHYRALRQFKGVLSRQLRVGGSQNSRAEQTKQRDHSNPGRTNAPLDGCGKDRHEQHNTALPAGSWVASGANVRPPTKTQEVYDIVNAGPRKRFTVRGRGGYPFIVSNCVMGEERDVIRWQTMQVPWRTVLMCYDESVFLAPDDEADDCLEAAVRAFSTSPPWAEGLPVKGKGRITDRYTK